MYLEGIPSLEEARTVIGTLGPTMFEAHDTVTIQALGGKVIETWVKDSGRWKRSDACHIPSPQTRPAPLDVQGLPGVPGRAGAAAITVWTVVPVVAGWTAGTLPLGLIARYSGDFICGP